MECSCLYCIFLAPGKTLGTVIDLFKEMAQLFEDEYFHIGCDETAVKGRCPLDSTFSFERSVLNAVSSMGKTPVGWEEVREKMKERACLH